MDHNTQVALAALKTIAIASLLPLCSCASYHESNLLAGVYKAQTKVLAEKYRDGVDSAKVVTSTENKDTRNEKIRDLVFLIDRQYEAHEKEIFEGKTKLDFLGSAAVIGVNAAGSITGGESLKAILHVVSGSIEGSKTAFTSEVLQGQNLLAIITKMRELRSAKLNPLLQGMTKTYPDYPMSQALIDLGEYYNAGTFTVALQDIVTTSTKQKEANDQRNQSAKTNQDITQKIETKPSGEITRTMEKN